ncbi:hypothetical protein ACFXKD_24775 [Nocardiopsis aegyptia]|uniref:hypothetical protein n=1 Tax=Nocardiopsis aegyptia TaxID=220378 RepID=UPI00367335B7
MSDPVLVLLHSPLVGALTWEPVADVLRADGRRVVVPSLVSALSGPGPYRPAYASAAARSVAGEDARTVVLVGHSAAGTHLPEVAAALEEAGTEVVGAVHADASLPHPGRSWSEAAPRDLRDLVRAMARDGFLPPWHTWFPDGTLEALLPDPDLRERFRADVPSVPAAYLEETAPDLPDPDHTAYLQLSAAYQDRGGEAARVGRPTRRLDLHHLAPLTHPEAVAAALADLLPAVQAAER